MPGSQPQPTTVAVLKQPASFAWWSYAVRCGPTFMHARVIEETGVPNQCLRVPTLPQGKMPACSHAGTNLAGSESFLLLPRDCPKREGGEQGEKECCLQSSRQAPMLQTAGLLLYF